jgi:hypothetical protein
VVDPLTAKEARQKKSGGSEEGVTEEIRRLR